MVLHVSPDSTCWSALDPPVFGEDRGRRVLTPCQLHRLTTRPGSSSQVPNPPSGGACQGGAPAGGACGRTTFTRDGGRPPSRLRGRARAREAESDLTDKTHPVDQQLDLRLIDKWRQNSPTEPPRNNPVPPAARRASTVPARRMPAGRRRPGSYAVRQVDARLLASAACGTTSVPPIEARAGDAGAGSGWPWAASKAAQEGLCAWASGALDGPVGSGALSASWRALAGL